MIQFATKDMELLEALILGSVISSCKCKQANIYTTSTIDAKEW